MSAASETTTTTTASAASSTRASIRPFEGAPLLNVMRESPDDLKVELVAALDQFKDFVQSNDADFQEAFKAAAFISQMASIALKREGKDASVAKRSLDPNELLPLNLLGPRSLSPGPEASGSDDVTNGSDGVDGSQSWGSDAASSDPRPLVQRRYNTRADINPFNQAASDVGSWNSSDFRPFRGAPDLTADEERAIQSGLHEILKKRFPKEYAREIRRDLSDIPVRYESGQLAEPETSEGRDQVSDPGSPARTAHQDPLPVTFWMTNLRAEADFEQSIEPHLTNKWPPNELLDLLCIIENEMPKAAFISDWRSDLDDLIRTEIDFEYFGSYKPCSMQARAMAKLFSAMQVGQHDYEPVLSKIESMAQDLSGEPLTMREIVAPQGDGDVATEDSDSREEDVVSERSVIMDAVRIFRADSYCEKNLFPRLTKPQTPELLLKMLSEIEGMPSLRFAVNWRPSTDAVRKEIDARLFRVFISEHPCSVQGRALAKVCLALDGSQRGILPVLDKIQELSGELPDQKERGVLEGLVDNLRADVFIQQNLTPWLNQKPASNQLMQALDQIKKMPAGPHNGGLPSDPADSFRLGLDAWYGRPNSPCSFQARAIGQVLRAVKVGHPSFDKVLGEIDSMTSRLSLGERTVIGEAVENLRAEIKFTLSIHPYLQEKRDPGEFGPKLWKDVEKLPGKPSAFDWRGGLEDRIRKEFDQDIFGTAKPCSIRARALASAFHAMKLDGGDYALVWNNLRRITAGLSSADERAVIYNLLFSALNRFADTYVSEAERSSPQAAKKALFVLQQLVFSTREWRKTEARRVAAATNEGRAEAGTVSSPATAALVGGEGSVAVDVPRIAAVCRELATRVTPEDAEAAKHLLLEMEAEQAA